MPQQQSSGGKKILLTVTVAAVVLVGAYLGWSKFQSRPAPVAVPVSAPPQAPPAQISATPSQPAPETQTTPSSTDVASSAESAVDNDPAMQEREGVSSVKTSPASKPSAVVAVERPERVPIVVKSAPPTQRPESIPQAPSVIGIADAGNNNAAISKIADVGTAAPKPVLQTLKISQGVSQGLLIKKIAPDYPAQARQLRIEGAVQLVATVGKDGKVSRIKTVGGHPILVRAATDAVKEWKYKPFLLNGQPIEFETQITINFRLP
jgi:TonB family protein